MGIIHSKASVDISTTPKAAEPADKATVTKDEDVQTESNAEVEVKVDETKDETVHLKPELLDVKESRVASLKRNLSFSKMKKMFSRGEAAGAETQEGEDEIKVEITSDEVGDAIDKAKEEEEVDDKEVAVPEEKSAVAEGDSKVTEWKNSLFKMFSRESADNEVAPAAASAKKEGTEEEQEVEGAGDGLKTEEGLEDQKIEGGDSKMTNLRKRLSFKAIKSRFTKEKKEEEEEEATAVKKNEEGDAVEEEVKADGDDEEAIKVASDDGVKEMEPPTEAPPAVPVQPAPEEDANAKNAQLGEPSENETLGEIGTPNADNTDAAVEGAVESLAAKTS